VVKKCVQLKRFIWVKRKPAGFDTALHPRIDAGLASVQRDRSLFPIVIEKRLFLPVRRADPHQRTGSIGASMRPLLIRSGNLALADQLHIDLIRFNEAAPDQERKSLRSIAQGDPEVASMRPLLIRSGNGDRGARQSPEVAASMRPLLIRSGNGHAVFGVRRRVCCFNEAAPDQERKCRRTATGATISGCFNEAAPDQERKSAIRLKRKPSFSCFNEAAPDQERKSNASVGQGSSCRSFNEAAPDQERK